MVSEAISDSESATIVRKIAPPTNKKIQIRETHDSASCWRS